MKYRMIDLSKDYDGKVDDFSKARNSFLDDLADNEYILFVADDEEYPKMLLDKISSLPPEYPYYWIRRIQLFQDKYISSWNPHYEGNLVSNKVRYHGRVHEHVRPHKPHGTIDIPCIHNQPDAKSTYVNMVPSYLHTGVYQYFMRIKKSIEVLRGR